MDTPQPTVSDDGRFFWDGGTWQPMPTTAKAGVSASKGITIVAIGILAALAVLWIVWRMSTPTDLDCSMQRADQALGKRDSIDSSCIGRD